MPRAVTSPHRTLERIAASVRACVLCPLSETRTNAVPGEGPRGRIFLIGEAPGREEDASGHPFVGQAGRILERALAAANLTREDVFISNLVKCRPPGNRRPKSFEVATCRPYLLAEIDAVRPRVIVTLGATALRGLFGPSHELRAARGQVLTFAGYDVLATYHPAAVLYNRKLERALGRDLRKAARRAGDARARRRGSVAASNRSD